MNRREDGRLHPDRLGGPGAAVGDTLVWDGFRFRPGAAGGDSDHPGSGSESVQIGLDADASGDETVAVGVESVASGTQTTAYGKNAWATGYRSTAIGAITWAYSDYSTCIGYGASAAGTGGTAVGHDTYANGARSVAIGKGANVSADDRGLVKVNELEIERSNGTGATSVILASPDGTRYRLAPPNGGGSIGWVTA